MSHTVTFNANGGTGTMTSEVASTSTALTTNTFTYYGFTFSGWNTAADDSGTAYADGAPYAFTADATLYAQWTANPVLTVTFHKNGHADTLGYMSPQTYDDVVALTLNNYSRTDKVFMGWNTKPDGTGTAYADGSSYDGPSSATLYAQWNSTVFFDDNQTLNKS
jgi:uncharacterized repeat protein (TIGR02543 family)